MSDTRDVIDAAVGRIHLEADAVRAVTATFDDATLAIVRLLATTSGRVHVSGSGTSGAVARRMAHLFSVTGMAAGFLHPADALHGSMGALRGDDVVIVISRGGGSAEINGLVERAKARGCQVVALTNDADAPLAKLVDHVQVFATPPGADPGELLAMGSNLMHAAWGDAVAMVVMRCSGYGWDQVLFTHPSGSVGDLDAPPGLAPLVLPEEGAAW